MSRHNKAAEFIISYFITPRVFFVTSELPFCGKNGTFALTNTYTHTMDTDNITVVLWDGRHADDFVRLNRQWIETFFEIEPSDIKLLGNPQKEIIDTGGQIFFAVDGEGAAVGCCALVYHPDTKMHELAKMAVDPRAQGKGIGTRMGNALIAYAREHGVKKLFLEANTKLVASVKLYRKLGFKDANATTTAYARCDLYMEMAL